MPYPKPADKVPSGVRCLACNKLRSSHHVITKGDVTASKGATFKAPKVVAGRKRFAPLSPHLVGSFDGHSFHYSARK